MNKTMEPRGDVSQNRPHILLQRERGDGDGDVIPEDVAQPDDYCHGENDG